MYQELHPIGFLVETSAIKLKYNPQTKETRLLLCNVQFLNGVSLSKDGSFFFSLVTILMEGWLLFDALVIYSLT